MKKKTRRARIRIDSSRITAYEEFLTQFKGESDRAAVILGTAKLDDLLYDLLLKFLLPNPGQSDDLLDQERPLSSLGAKISICNRLGILDNDFARSLHLIRKIRNEFAHASSTGQLHLSPHRERVRQLVDTISDTAFFKDVKEMYFRDKHGPTSDFFSALAVMVARLETIYVKIRPLTSAKAYPIVPENYSSIFRGKPVS